MISSQELTASVATALKEDIGSGDITAHIIPVDARSQAQVISRETAVICSITWFNEVFRQLDESVAIDWSVADGDEVSAGQVLCRLHGPSRSLLTGERTALNFLQTLCATTTISAQYAEAVSGTHTKILDTRKTIPGLRAAQKYAVRCDGCHNHRHGLYDAILIKENHIAAAGSISQAVTTAKRNAALDTALVEVEVESLDQIEPAIAAGATRLLLDNMNLTQLRRAVTQVAGRVELEASGGIRLSNVRKVAETGVDYISVGEITKNIIAIDLSLRFL